MTERCKYSLDRLKQIVREHGVRSAVDDIDASAIADSKIRTIWLRIHKAYDDLEALLLPVNA